MGLSEQIWVGLETPPAADNRGSSRSDRCQPPFDRHDWYVQRQMPDGQAREVRYVIDYYSAPPDPSGESVFYLDIRPAIDRPSAAVERLMRWGGDVWYRMSGAASRDGSSQQLRTSVDR